MSNPNLFIIESLTLEDEKSERFEGHILSKILKMVDKESIYYYIRTKKELINILKDFSSNNYRYLHFSCHGNKNSIALTYDNLDFNDLGDIIKPYINKKRLFFSACSTINTSFIKHAIGNSGCLSIIGPSKDIKFSDAAVVWAAFYNLMFNISETGMKNSNIEKILRDIGLTFNFKLKSYFLNKNKYVQSNLSRLDSIQHKITTLDKLDKK